MSDPNTRDLERLESIRESVHAVKQAEQQLAALIDERNRRIRRAYAYGVKTKDIAPILDTSPTRINNIIAGRK